MRMRLSAGLLTLAIAWHWPALAQSVEADIRSVILAVNKAYAQNDLPAYWSHYDPTLTQWWPEGRVDLASYQRQWTEYINAGGRVLAADVSDLQIQIDPSGDAAVATYRLAYQDQGRRQRRVDPGDSGERRAVQTRKRVWKIVHLHYSNVAHPNSVSSCEAP